VGEHAHARSIVGRDRRREPGDLVGEGGDEGGVEAAEEPELAQRLYDRGVEEGRAHGRRPGLNVDDGERGAVCIGHGFVIHAITHSASARRTMPSLVVARSIARKMERGGALV
jgi:hypothetical protein